MFVCPVCVLNFECILTWSIPFWCASSSLEYLGHVCISRSLGQGQGHGNKKLEQTQENEIFRC